MLCLIIYLFNHSVCVLPFPSRKGNILAAHNILKVEHRIKKFKN